MTRDDLRSGVRVKHFKREHMTYKELTESPTKYTYEIIGTAMHTETGDQLIIYRALYGDKAMYARPVEMFLSKVDREKYPYTLQEYRFEVFEGTELGKPKYHRGDKVFIRNRNNAPTAGVVEIVDAYGTFEQKDEPSYDVFIEEENCLYKHIRESQVLGTCEKTTD